MTPGQRETQRVQSDGAADVPVHDPLFGRVLLMLLTIGAVVFVAIVLAHR